MQIKSFKYVQPEANPTGSDLFSRWQQLYTVESEHKQAQAQSIR